MKHFNDLYKEIGCEYIILFLRNHIFREVFFGINHRIKYVLEHVFKIN